MRWLVFIAVVVTIIAFLYYYHPTENPIDWFSRQKPGTTTGTVTTPAQRPVGAPFQDLTMTDEGTSPLQNPPPNAPAVKPSPRPPLPPPPPPQRLPKSAKLKFLKMASENEVTILSYLEQPIGDVTVTCQAKDKNNIYDFEDALLKFGIRDFDQARGAFRMQMDPDGRTLVTATFRFKYIPEY